MKHSTHPGIRLACWLMIAVMPFTNTLAVDPEPAPPLRDVQLRAGSVKLHVLDSMGQPAPGQEVRLRFQNTDVARAKSNSDGHVVFRNVRPGVHTLAAGKNSTLVRFWDERQAPPSAVNAPAIVVGTSDVRGQYGPPVVPMMAPVMLATGVAATALIVVLVGKNSASNHQPASP